MRNQPTYWLNNDSTGVTLHESGCAYVRKWARPPKWKEFPTTEAARNSTRRAIRDCGDCMSPGFVSRYEVVERMAARVMSEIRENPESDWAFASERIKREFAGESATLYCQAQCDYRDGSDLIAEAVAHEASQIQDIAVGNMKTALVSAVENSPRGMALWSSVKEDILRENNLAIGALREYGLSAPDGSDLVGDALDASGLRIVSRCDVLPGRKVKYIMKGRGKDPCPEEKRKGDVWPPRLLRSLTWVHVIIGIAAALSALIGITIWDIIPIPCDLWPFYQLPRCP